jgi:hypothetical protein
MSDLVVNEEDIFEAIDPLKYSFDMLLWESMCFHLSSNFRLKDPSRDLWYGDALNSKELKKKPTETQLQRAEKICIRAIQNIYFSTKLDNLQSQKKAWRPALVSQLFLDTDQIIRCKRQA